MGKFLITTADERTWKFDRPVVFLGEWCRLYERKHLWENMDAIVADPYGLKASQKEQDLLYIENLHQKMLSELTTILNEYHGTSHSLRYWHIRLGHWLIIYLAIALNRYRTLEIALKKYEIDSTMVIDAPNYSLATDFGTTINLACNNDVWNNILYSKILNYWNEQSLEKEVVFLDNQADFSQMNYSSGGAPKRDFKSRVIKAAQKVASHLHRKKDAFIINSYLPKKEEIKLQLSLGQCPQFWKSPVVEGVPVDLHKRQLLKLEMKACGSFEGFVRRYIMEMIPVCYLEGHYQLVKTANALPWPTRPKFIFTSNNYNGDEVFKVWACNKIENGTPYFIGQHGNLYGTERGSQNFTEVLTADRFLTWGWTDESSKNIPAFVFKIAGRKIEKNRNNKDGLLLIELHPPHFRTTWDCYAEFGIYQEEQFRFVEALPEVVRRDLTVRLHQGYKAFRWSDTKRWNDRAPEVSIDSGLKKIMTLVDESRLVVHSYDSTGILETLALNIPTISFWHGGFDHLLPSARPYYELLRDAGIFFDTPEMAAKIISLNWNHVNEWWGSDKIQSARRIFCDRYAKFNKAPISFLRRSLIQNAK